MRYRHSLIVAVALAMAGTPAALAQAQQGSGQATKTRSYTAVENSLKQAGIQNVRTLDTAYLVSATTKEGDQVTLVIDPTGSGASAAGQAGASNQQTALRNQQQIRQDLTNAGFQNVQIVDAQYLAMGKTKAGDDVTMMIDPSMQARSGSTSGGAGGGAGGAQPPAGQRQ